jgi:hypothetical protein
MCEKVKNQNASVCGVVMCVSINPTNGHAFHVFNHLRTPHPHLIVLAL